MITPAHRHTAEESPGVFGRLAKRFARTSAALLAATFVAGCSTTTPTVEPAPALTEAQVALEVESFDYVWESIRDNHWDPDLNGVDWDLAREELRPRVEMATSRGEARAAMNALLGRLELSHFAIIPGDAYERYESTVSADDNDGASSEEAETPARALTEAETEAEEEAETPDGWSGLEARLRGGRLLITRVHDDSPASAAQIRAGWHIERIGSTTAEEIIVIAKELEGVQRAETIVALILMGRLGGDEGDTVRLAIADDAGAEREFELTLAEAPGELASMGNLPPTPVVVETRTLDNGVGYFRLNVFFDPPRVLSEYRAFINEHMDAPGIVIDMRGNLGGIILMASGMMNFLIDESGLELGTMTMRDPVRGAFEMPIMLNPRGTTYEGKVAVLIDEQSISNAEILAASLKDIGRARLFGTRTAGLVLPSTVERLPNGDGFQYAFASYVSAGGGRLEGVGAIPDVPIKESSDDLLRGIDGPLDAAATWILEDE